MSWQDRIQEAAYTSPSGERFTFDFEDVRTTVEKRTSAFEFPDVDGTYVQDLGRAGRRFPLRMFFWGDNCDTDAEALDAALLERGQGKLEHPMYGTFDVVPFGMITRRDDLKTSANQAVLEVTFYETTGTAYPTGQADPLAAVEEAIEEAQEQAAEQFSEAADLAGAIEKATLKSQIGALIDKATGALGPIANTVASVERKFNAIKDSINGGIDLLIGKPLTLGFQVSQLLLVPSQAIANVTARLSAYRDLARSLISGDGAIAAPGLDSRNANEFHARDLFASNYVTASVASVVANTFATKPEALAAAETLFELLDDVTEWRDSNFESLGEIDPGGAYQKVQEAVALAAGFLVQISFTLRQERRVVLDRARTPIELVSELYGEIDEQLDFFISSNDLTGSEILEIPEGREVVYYI